MGATRGWAAAAIVVGAWEAAAVSSRGRIPTITLAVRAARSRRQRATEVGVLLVLSALARHLLS